MKETDIVKSIIKTLNQLPGTLVWRANTGAMPLTYKGKQRFVRFGQPGQADISGIGQCGIRIEIEVKRPGKRSTQTDAQKTYQELITKHGGVYLLVTSADEAIGGLCDAVTVRINNYASGNSDVYESIQRPFLAHSRPRACNAKGQDAGEKAGNRFPGEG
jgi:hypothetical protein